MKRDFAVIGLGSFGSKLCLELGAQGANVVAVDLDEERVNRIAEQIPLAYCCDCTKEETLKKLDLDEVDCVIVAIGKNLEATIEKVAPEEIFNEKIMQIRPGCDGLILQPYWGPGLSRPLAKGSIIGFYDVHTKYHIYRSIIEGIGYALKEGLESIERHGKLSVQYLTVSGGGSKSDAICQITSDLFNLPVYKSETYESSSLGCAMAQFVALGIYKDVEEAKDKMVRYVKKFTPNKLAVKEYKDLYNNIYIKVYPSLKNVYKALSDFKEKRDKEEIEVH